MIRPIWYALKLGPGRPVVSVSGRQVSSGKGLGLVGSGNETEVGLPLSYLQFLHLWVKYELLQCLIVEFARYMAKMLHKFMKYEN